MKKVLRIAVAIVVIGLCVCAWLTISEQNKMKEYSTYCMDRVRHELWEQLENIHITDAFCSEWTCVYMWGTTYEWVDYSFSCKVYNKENVELDLEPLYPEEQPVVEEDISNAKMRVVEWQTEEETQAMVENACSNAGWTWTDWACYLEDWSQIAF